MMVNHGRPPDFGVPFWEKTCASWSASSVSNTQSAICVRAVSSVLDMPWHTRQTPHDQAILQCFLIDIDIIDIIDDDDDVVDDDDDDRDENEE